MNIKKISAGKNPENGEVNVLIEIPQGGNVKYEIDKESGAIVVDRFLYTAMNYPFNYGFVPNTLAGDGDPSDIVVLSEHPVMPGMVIACHVIGMLEMEDEEGIDTKILAVPTKKIDPLYGMFQDMSDVPEATKNKLRHFFENYKTLEPGKWVKLKEWRDKKTAIADIKHAVANAK